ncbi:UBX domain-containing protein 11 isoform X2 [Ambystoma mexicanum]|uniref:UBX domain-containing protein 11 isoform X2 n=1 Tax=Ambystoma mexicanum TaxID=8296 RepID=UPI0037E994D5
MSSPGASLGRVRRAPLPGLPSPGRVVPFKAGAYTDEALLLNDVLLPRYKVPGEATSTQEYDTKRSVMGGAPNDLELMATMMHKLGLLEQRVKSQAQELHQKDRTISTLEEKINILKKQAKEGSSEPSRVLELEKRCLELQNRVWEMEGFLNDYGMVWVGDKETESNGESAEGEMPEQKAQQPQGLWKPGHSTPSSFLVDFDVILENVKDLNALAGEGEARIEHTEGGARLRQPDPIPLTLYQNGIILFRGPFRSYQEPSTQRCVQDIMDGYFPSELQSRFPDGIPFQVTDRRTVTFRETQRWDTFPGQGQVVGGPLSGGDSTLETSEAPGPKLSLDQFLNKLPRAVVKGGQVLDIRGPIQEHLQGSGRTKDSAVILVETPALTALQERLKVEPQNRPPSAQNLTTLRVKSERGDQTYIMKMLFTETIEDLRTHLAAHRGPETSSYDIISTFPQQVYHDGTKTLKECGLIPNATLHLQAKKF